MRRTRRLRNAFDHGEPIHRINTLPLLLFCTLVAMLALLWASRTPTHALLIDLPISIPIPPEISPGTVHVVGTTALGRPTLDGMELTREQLRDRLQAIASAPAPAPAPAGIVFEPADNARYEDALRTLALVKETGLADARFCFGGTDRNRRFAKSSDRYALRLTTLFDVGPGIERPHPASLACSSMTTMPVPIIE